jgi:hypothetical protein
VDRAETTNAGFYAVTEISPSDVWAVGKMDGLGQTVPLTEHWTGTVWRSVPTPLQPLIGANLVTLDGVAGASGSDVWAVGGLMAQRMSFGWMPLTEHWDGSAWSIANGPSPVPPRSASTILAGVTRVPGSTAMWAVALPQGNASGPFTERTC